MEKKVLRLRWLLLGLLLVPGVAWAQDTATLTGTVRDISGAVVPNADVSIKNTATGIVRAVKSNSAGEYVAAALAPGQYNITVSVAGFRNIKRRGSSFAWRRMPESMSPCRWATSTKK